MILHFLSFPIHTSASQTFVSVSQVKEVSHTPESSVRAEFTTATVFTISWTDLKHETRAVLLRPVIVESTAWHILRTKIRSRALRDIQKSAKLPKKQHSNPSNTAIAQQPCHPTASHTTPDLPNLPISNARKWSSKAKWMDWSSSSELDPT